MTSYEDALLSDLSKLKALAHPLRQRILGSLRVDGPATSTTLARGLGTDTGQTSFHLRRLARDNLVIDAPEMGKGGERWWKTNSGSTTWDPSVLLRDAATESVLVGFEEAAVEVWTQALRDFMQSRREWSPEWVDAASSADYQIRLRATDLVKLVTEVRNAVQRYDLGSAAPADAELVTVQLQAFPRRRRP